MKQYERYKESGVEWLGRVPEQWEVNNLKYYFHENININYKLERINALQFKFGEVVEKPNQEEKIDLELSKILKRYTIVNCNDIIINGLNLNYDFLTQRVAIVRRGGIITSAYITLNPNKNINPFFYNYYFKSLDNKKVFNGMGVGIRLTLSFNELKKVKIPIPSIVEQNEIVNYLDQKCAQIDKAISQKERVIELLNERRQIIIQRAVTRGLDPDVPMKDSGVDWIGEIPEHWEVRKLKTFCDFVNRGTTPNYESSGYKVVNQATFSKGFFDESDVRYTSLKNTDARGYLKKGDLLLASTGGGVLGKSFLFQEEGEYIADSHVTILRDTKERFFPSFLIKFLSTHFDLINGILAQGSTNQIELQREWLRDMQFPYPSYEEQQQIAAYLDTVNAKIDKAIAIKRQEIEKLKEYKTVLIDAAVTGKIKIA